MPIDRRLQALLEPLDRAYYADPDAWHRGLDRWSREYRIARGLPPRPHRRRESLTEWAMRDDPADRSFGRDPFDSPPRVPVSRRVEAPGRPSYNPNDGAGARYDRAHGIPDHTAERRSPYGADAYGGAGPSREDDRYGAWQSPPRGRPITPDNLGGFGKGTQGYDDWVKHLAFRD